LPIIDTWKLFCLVKSLRLGFILADHTLSILLQFYWFPFFNLTLFFFHYLQFTYYGLLCWPDIIRCMNRGHSFQNLTQWIFLFQLLLLSKSISAKQKSCMWQYILNSNYKEDENLSNNNEYQPIANHSSSCWLNIARKTY
jgi:hypothetical protein